MQGANTGNPGTQSSNVGQNGNLNGVPIGTQFIPGFTPTTPGQPPGFVPANANHSRGNGVFYFSPQQSRINIETRTPTAWGESRTFFEFDWSGCNNFGCQTVQQGGGDSIVPRLRFAYGTLGGFLGGQAISNFSDADADTESVDFGGAMGSTGGLRIPQVRYTLAGPYGVAFSGSLEQPQTSMWSPGGMLSSDANTGGLPGGPGTATISATCNGVACTGAGTAINGNIARSTAPNLTFAAYGSQPWGHQDLSGVVKFNQVVDGRFISQKFLGYGFHYSGDVKPGWLGWNKDDFLFSVVAGEGLGNYVSGGWANAVAMSTNYTVATQCASPVAGPVRAGWRHRTSFSSRISGTARMAATSIGGRRTCGRP